MTIRHGMLASGVLLVAVALVASGAANAQSSTQDPELARAIEALTEDVSRLQQLVESLTEDRQNPFRNIVRIPSVTGETESVTRVFEIVNVSSMQLAGALSLFPAEVASNNNLRTLTVRAEPEIVSAIADVIQRLDVAEAQTTADLTVHVLSPDSEGVGPPVPGHLDNVTEQLRATFGYGAMRLIDTIFVRGVDGRSVQLNGVLTLPSAGNVDLPASQYSFQGVFEVIDGEDSTFTLRVEGFRMGFRVPVLQVAADAQDGPVTVRNYTFQDAQINTNVDVPAGTEVVVGKTSAGESALFLVLTAAFPE